MIDKGIDKTSRSDLTTLLIDVNRGFSGQKAFEDADGTLDVLDMEMNQAGGPETASSSLPIRRAPETCFSWRIGTNDHVRRRRRRVDWRA
jgi:hypothetical protein